MTIICDKLSVILFTFIGILKIVHFVAAFNLQAEKEFFDVFLTANEITRNELPKRIARKDFFELIPKFLNGKYPIGGCIGLSIDNVSVYPMDAKEFVFFNRNVERVKYVPSLTAQLTCGPNDKFLYIRKHPSQNRYFLLEEHDKIGRYRVTQVADVIAYNFIQTQNQTYNNIGEIHKFEKLAKISTNKQSRQFSS